MSQMFPEMVKILAPAEKGEAKITHFEVTRDLSMMSALRGGMNFTSPGIYINLHVSGTLMMSDTRHERISNWGVVNNAKGRVFIAGLGVGMILHPIAAKEEVKSIVVMEKSQDVIDLVKPSLPKKVTLVVCDDVLEFKPPKELQYDTIYFDIWPDITTENLPEINMLHRRWRSRLTPDGWMDSWCRDHLRSERRREREQEREFG